MRSLAESGHADAQYELGMWYLDNNNPNADEAWAITWLRRAAKQGNEPAAKALEGIYVSHGVSLKQHPLEKKQTQPEEKIPQEPATEKISIPPPKKQEPEPPEVFVAADISHQDLMLEMASAMDAYARKDFELAASVFSRLAKRGETYAQYRLGLMYLAGEGLNKNRTKANDWLIKASEHGHAGARAHLELLDSEVFYYPEEETPPYQQFPESADENDVSDVDQQLPDSAPSPEITTDENQAVTRQQKTLPPVEELSGSLQGMNKKGIKKQ